MPNIKLKAIILKRISLGEADRIVTAFSFELGKIRFVAKGVRRTKSKFAGSIEPFCLVDIQLASGKSLDILTSANIIKNYLDLSPDLETIKFANFVGEVIDKVIPDNTPTEEIFHLVDNVLGHLNKVTTEVLKVYFLAKLFEILGLSPETEVCLKCGEKPTDRLYISKGGGGLLDENCCLYFGDSHEIDVTSIKYLRFLKENTLQKAINAKVPEKILMETLSFLNDYLKHISNKSFKSDSI